MYHLLHELDIQLFELINHLPHNPYFDILAIFVHLLTLTGIIFFVISVYLWFRSSKKERFIPVVAIVLWLVTFLVNFFIFKPLFHRERPPNKIDQTIIIGVIPDNNSFPSGQAATVMAYAIPFLLLSKKKKTHYFLITIVLLTGLDRVYMGHHYPFDVIAGYITGGIIGIAGTKIWQSMMRK